MKKINLIKDTSNYEKWFELEDGRKLDIPYRYDAHIDIENLFLYGANERYDLPTINDLVLNKKGNFRYGYDIVDFDIGLYFDREDVTEATIDDIVSYFREHGYKVTRKAIKHNLKAYFMDMKSGYRDEINNYHIFTPCSCNPLSFRLTSLNRNTDWQTTYIC